VAGAVPSPYREAMATDPELGDLDNTSRTELEQVARRRVELGDTAGAQPLVDELNSRPWQGRD
jgi:hypothetical protein